MKHRPIFIIAFLLFGLLKISSQQAELNFYELRAEMDMYFAENEKKSGYKQYKRAEYYFDTRLDKDGSILNIDAKKWSTWNDYRRTISRNSERSYAGDWDFVGPAYHSNHEGLGRVNRIAFHPTDEDILYAATAGGGLWYTPNHGTVWFPLTDGIPVNNLSGVAIDYTNPDIMYILTGDGDGCCGGARSYGLRKPSIGVLKSFDGGDIWSKTGLEFDEQDVVWSYDLKMHPTNPSILFASTDNGLYRSLDGGDSWFLCFTGLINEMEFMVGTPSTIFAVDDDNVYKSTTLGITWSDTVPIPDLDGAAGRMAITTCASKANTLYLIASPGEDTSVHRGLFISTDAGESFAMVSDSPNIVQNQPNFDLCISCNPNDPNDVLVGAVDIWKSTDAGGNFSIDKSTHADIHELISSPLNDRLYAATDGGVYYSDDFGDSWLFISQWLQITQYYKLAVSQFDDNLIIAGSQDNGTHRDDNINAIMERIYVKDGMDCAIHPLNDDLMIYSAQNGQFVMSTDGGDSEDSLLFATSLPASVEAGWVTPVAWNPNDANNIMLGFKPIYRTTDGSTFAPISDTISGLRILHIGTSNSSRVYAGDWYDLDSLNTFHLWTSQDGGDSWTPLHQNVGFPDTTLLISSLTTNPNNSAEVWITVGGWAAGQKVFRSMNAGNSWSNMTGTLPNIPVNTIAYQDPDLGVGDAVYIGTDLGVFYRDVNLGDWIYYWNEMPLVEIADLEIRYSDNKIVAATHGRGIWESDLHSSCIFSYVLPGFIQFTGFSYFFQASNHINSTATIDGFGSRVIYKAGQQVTLQDGFHATAHNGAFFKAVNGDCIGGIESAILPGEEEQMESNEVFIAPVKGKN